MWIQDIFVIIYSELNFEYDNINILDSQKMHIDFFHGNDDM